MEDFHKDMEDIIFYLKLKGYRVKLFKKYIFIWVDGVRYLLFKSTIGEYYAYGEENDHKAVFSSSIDEFKNKIVEWL